MRRLDDCVGARAGIRVRRLGVGGLIQAAVGLSGGVRLVDEALRPGVERRCEGSLASGVGGVGPAVTHLVRGHEADPGVVVVPVASIEEPAAEAPGALDAAEAPGEARPMPRDLEAALGERGVVGRVRAVARARHSGTGGQQGGRAGLHRAALVGARRQLAGRHVVLGDRIIEQRPEQRGALGVGHATPDDPAAEDVEDHVKVEAAPFGGPHQLGNVPRPDLVRTFCQEFGLLVGGMAALRTALADLAVLAKQPIHGANRAVVDALIEQTGVDLGRRLVSEARGVQQVQHRLLLRNTQSPCRPRSRAKGHRRRGQAGTAALHAGA